jgi:aerobic-type carbon monoxide dehydrogenase small subunit (CoxS/CutS family)
MLMSEQIRLTVNGAPLIVPPGAPVAVAIVLAGGISRKSVSGDKRGPLCGMGICYECRAVVNGEAHSRTCQILCQEGMEIRTDE